MKTYIKLFTEKNGEIKRFLNSFFIPTEKILETINDNTLELEIDFENPVEMSDIIGAFIENIDEYKINIWLSIDEDVLINVTKNNGDDIIRYLFERYPY